MPVQEVSRSALDVCVFLPFVPLLWVHPDAWDEGQTRGDFLFVLDVILSKEMDERDLLFLDTLLEEPPASQSIGHEA